MTLLSRNHVPYSSFWGFAPLRRLPRCPAPRTYPGDSAPDSLLLSGTRCQSVLQSPGPYAPHSCYPRGCMPPSPATHGDSTPLHIPHSSHRGLRAPPVPLPCLPYRRASFPRPSSLIGRRSPAHPVL